MEEERLQRFWPRPVTARAAHRVIIAGRVKVNGKVAELGMKADPSGIDRGGRSPAAGMTAKVVPAHKPRGL